MRSHCVALLVVGCTVASLACAPSRGTPDSSPRTAGSWEERVVGHAIPVRTIEPADENWSDLTPLAPLLSDVRLVVLGEATHGDGTTLLAKTRLIEFLHQRLDFDLLVFESGFYDCSRAWPPTGGNSAAAAFEKCAWPIWSQRRELESLVSYLERTQAQLRPMVLAGLDPDIGVPSAYGARAQELRRLLQTFGNSAVSAEELSGFLSFADHADDYRGRKRPLPGADSLKAVVATANRLAAAIRRNEQLSRRDREYWALVLEGLANETQARFIARMYSSSPPDPQAAWEATLARDAQMARNMYWLMEEAYPGSKAIVWVSTVHAARQLSSLSLLVSGDQRTPFGFSLQELFQRRRTLGDHLHDRFGSSMYAIGFTAGGGTTTGGPSGRPIPAPSSGSLEELLGRTGEEYAFLDLRGVSAAPPGRLVARPIGHTEMSAPDWGRILDAVFFIRAMAPSTPRQSR